MVALAFTVHVTPPAPALPAVPPAASVTSVTSSESPAVTAAATAGKLLPGLPPRETPLYLGSAIIVTLIGGFALRVRAERAPPLA